MKSYHQCNHLCKQFIPSILHLSFSIIQDNTSLMICWVCTKTFIFMSAGNQIFLRTWKTWNWCHREESLWQALLIHSSSGLMYGIPPSYISSENFCLKPTYESLTWEVIHGVGLHKYSYVSHNLSLHLLKLFFVHTGILLIFSTIMLVTPIIFELLKLSTI